MGIVHVAIFDAAVAIGGSYQSTYDATGAGGYLCGGRGRDRRVRHADRAAAAVRREPGDPRRRLGAFMARCRRGGAEENGIRVGSQVGAGVLAPRTNDGRGCTASVTNLGLPSPAPASGNPVPVARVLRAIACRGCGRSPYASPFTVPARPDPSRWRARPTPTTSIRSGSWAASTARAGRPAQTNEARFWTDHDLRQWNDGLLPARRRA